LRLIARISSAGRETPELKHYIEITGDIGRSWFLYEFSNFGRTAGARTTRLVDN